MPADAVPPNGDLPGSGAVATDRFFSPREVYLLVLSVAVVIATYVIGGYPLGYLRFPVAVYWLVMGARYLQATRAADS
jgi:uncharacterized membrane protein YhhN